MGSAPAVAVSHLSKYFPLITRRHLITGKWHEGVWALREVNLKLYRREVLLIKLIATLLAPAEGSIMIHGRDAGRFRLPVKRRLGYITCNESSFYGRLTGWQNLAFFARLHNLDRPNRHPAGGGGPQADGIPGSLPIPPALNGGWTSPGECCISPTSCIWMSPPPISTP